MVNVVIGFKEVDITMKDSTREIEYKRKRTDERVRDKRTNWNIAIGESSCYLQIQYNQYHNMEDDINFLIPSPSVDLNVGSFMKFYNCRSEVSQLETKRIFFLR